MHRPVAAACVGALLLCACGMPAATPAAPIPGLAPLWSARIGGSAAGIPAVAGGTVLVAGPGPELRAYEARDGRPLWQAALPAGADEVPGPPLVVGGQVVLLAGSTLSAFNLATGAPLWHHGVPGLRLASGALQAVAGDVLPPANGLPLYDAVTGALVRELTPGVDLGGEGGSPVAVQGQTVLSVEADGGVAAHNLDGRLLWRAGPPPAQGPLGQPADGEAFVGVDSGADGIAVAMEGYHWPCARTTPSSCRDDGALRAIGLDTASGHVAWVQPQGTNLAVVSAAGGTPAAMEAGNGVALSLADGRILWSLPLASMRYYSSVAPGPNASFLAFAPLVGRLLEVDAADGRTVASAAVPPPPNRGLDPRPHLAADGRYAAVTTDGAELEVFALGE